ncbi:MAG: hypothetical protein ACREKF_07430, partial [Candidatus Methylomirabilales bacterium]
MSLDRLLSQAVKAGGQELRLIPGRRIVILTAAGEREVQGAAQTTQAIEELLESVLTPDARVDLSSGTADWQMEMAGVGRVRATVERKAAGLVAIFALGKDGSPAPAPAPGEAPPAPPAARRRLTGPTAELDELFYTMAEMKASDLHMSVGSP